MLITSAAKTNALPTTLAVATRPLPRPLPKLEPLELRVTFDTQAGKGASFIDLHPTQVDTEPLGNRKSYSTFAEARDAAHVLSGARSTAVAVVQGLMDFGQPSTPAFFVTPLEIIRRGHVNGDGLSGSFVTGSNHDSLPRDTKFDGVATVDLSEIRYVMWNESVQAIVSGETELLRSEASPKWSSTLLGGPLFS